MALPERRRQLLQRRQDAALQRFSGARRERVGLCGGNLGEARGGRYEGWRRLGDQPVEVVRDAGDLLARIDDAALQLPAQLRVDLRDVGGRGVEQSLIAFVR